MDNQELFERALKTIPGGVNSPVRSFGAVGGTPYFVERGLGAYVWDVQGNRYLDFVQSYGASILGHADPQVVFDTTHRGNRLGIGLDGSSCFGWTGAAGDSARRSQAPSFRAGPAESPGRTALYHPP